MHLTAALNHSLSSIKTHQFCCLTSELDLSFRTPNVIYSTNEKSFFPPLTTQKHTERNKSKSTYFQQQRKRSCNQSQICNPRFIFDLLNWEKNKSGESRSWRLSTSPQQYLTNSKTASNSLHQNSRNQRLKARL